LVQHNPYALKTWVDIISLHSLAAPQAAGVAALILSAPEFYKFEASRGEVAGIVKGIIEKLSYPRVEETEPDEETPPMVLWNGVDLYRNCIRPRDDSSGQCSKSTSTSSSTTTSTSSSTTTTSSSSSSTTSTIVSVLRTPGDPNPRPTDTAPIGTYSQSPKVDLPPTNGSQFGFLCLFSDISENQYNVTLNITQYEYDPTLGQCLQYDIFCNCYDGNYTVYLDFTYAGMNGTASIFLWGPDGIRIATYNQPCGVPANDAYIGAVKG